MNRDTIIRTLTLLAVVALVVWLVWTLRLLIAFFCISAVIAILGGPMVVLLRRIKPANRAMPSWVAAALTLVSIVGFLSLLAVIFAPLILEQIDIISRIDAGKVSRELHIQLEGLNHVLLDAGVISEPLTTEGLISEGRAYFSVRSISGWFGSLLGAMTNVLMALFSILFISFFFLKDPDLIHRILMVVTPDNHTEQVKRIELNIGRLLTRYFVGILIQITAVTVVVWLGLTLFGVRNALLIGFLAGLLNVVPYLGPLMGATAGVFIAVLAHFDAGDAESLAWLVIRVASVFAVMQLMDNFLFQPLIFSNSVIAHPLEIFAVIFAAGTLSGIGGMIIAIPAYTVLRVIAKEFLSEYKWVERLTKNI
jgi:predicted PurR-regulated permease PerM